ncbi:hypothetical protein CF15_00805 [Pyrodictium occultum]|uniref:GTP cyclohydrolase III n=1 Tax=Pyrodictium occultum TaxID=2309 RepID=A0A0V8RTP3_PYROC|nr:GTP cyclohydrolase IIa [Pyrodictium occultum]KSW11431.1 hypothetical protein CF15_00805 [Pyrodictium occultum]
MPLLVGVIALLGYREWTESLGYDREWAIQGRQAAIYRAAVEAAALHGGHVIPASHDIMIALLNGVPLRAVESLYKAMSRESPVPVAIRVTSTSRPGWSMPPLEPGVVFDGEPEEPGSEVAAIHIDMNGVSSERLRKGFITPFAEVAKLHARLVEKALPRGYIPGYLGGDNLVVFAPAEELEEALELVQRLIDGGGYKLGVGVAASPREALARAAHALSVIRSRRDLSLYIIGPGEKPALRSPGRC